MTVQRCHHCQRRDSLPPSSIPSWKRAGWGNKTVIRDKHGLGWESGKPQWQIGVEIRAEQGLGCKEELTPQTGCSQSRAKTIRWQTTLCATDVVLNPVHKKSFRYPTPFIIIEFLSKAAGQRFCQKFNYMCAACCIFHILCSQLWRKDKWL